MTKKRHFADDLDQGGNSHQEGSQNLNQYGNLQNMWNAIQDDYLKNTPISKPTTYISKGEVLWDYLKK